MLVCYFSSTSYSRSQSPVRACTVQSTSRASAYHANALILVNYNADIKDLEPAQKSGMVEMTKLDEHRLMITLNPAKAIKGCRTPPCAVVVHIGRYYPHRPPLLVDVTAEVLGYRGRPIQNCSPPTQEELSATFSTQESKRGSAAAMTQPQLKSPRSAIAPARPAFVAATMPQLPSTHVGTDPIPDSEPADAETIGDRSNSDSGASVMESDTCGSASEGSAPLGLHADDDVESSLCDAGRATSRPSAASSRQCVTSGSLTYDKGVGGASLPPISNRGSSGVGGSRMGIHRAMHWQSSSSAAIRADPRLLHAGVDIVSSIPEGVLLAHGSNAMSLHGDAMLGAGTGTGTGTGSH